MFERVDAAARALNFERHRADGLFFRGEVDKLRHHGEEFLKCDVKASRRSREAVVELRVLLGQFVLGHTDAHDVSVFDVDAKVSARRHKGLFEHLRKGLRAREEESAVAFAEFLFYAEAQFIGRPGADEKFLDERVLLVLQQLMARFATTSCLLSRESSILLGLTLSAFAIEGHPFPTVPGARVPLVPRRAA